MKRTRKIKFNHFLIFVALAAVLVLMLLTASILYAKTKTFIDEKKDFIHSTRMNQIAYDVGKIFDGLYHIADNLKQNERLIAYIQNMQSNKLDPYQKFFLSKEIESYLYNIKKENSFVQHILVLTDNNQYSSNQKYVDYELVGRGKLVKRSGETSLVPPGKTGDFFEIGQPGGKAINGPALAMLDNHLYLASVLTDKSGQRYGTLFVVLDSTQFTEAVAGHEHIALLNKQMIEIFKGGTFNELKLGEMSDAITRTEDSGKIVRDNVSIRIKSIPFYELKLLYLEENSFHNKQLRLLAALIAGTFLLCTLMAFVSSRIISGKMLFPVRRLIQLLERYDVEKNMLNRYRPLKTQKLFLRDRFFLYFLITIMFPLTSFIVIYYWQSSAIMAGEIKRSYYTVYEKNANEIEHFLNQKEIIMARLAYDSIVQEDLQTLPPGGEARIAEIHKLVGDYRYLGSDKDTIRIFDRQFRLLYSNRLGLADELGPDYFSKLQASGSYFGYSVQTDEFGNHAVTLGIPVKHLSQLSETIGYITLSIDGIYLQNLYSSGKASENETFLVDWNHQVISHQNKDAVLRRFGAEDMAQGDGDYTVIDGKRQYVYATQLKHLPWTYVSVYDYSSVRNESLRLIYNDLYLVVIIFLLVLILSYVMAHLLLKPLSRLNALFMRFELEDVDYQFADEDAMIDEVDQLGRTFNAMIGRIEDLVDDAIIAEREKTRLEYEKRETQITALQAQINPHFLYNTLDTFIFMLEKNERAKAIEMVTSLSRLFRYITNKEQLLVPVKEELAYAKAYVHLMKYRYDHIVCNWHVDDAALECRTLKLILQPVIENAIHHGLRGRDSLRIDISIRAAGGSVLMSVSDDGAGIGERELAEIRSQLTGAGHHRIGIYNVNARIKLNYGDGYGLHIESGKGRGTTVSLVLPMETLRSADVFY
ncbi:sensor histidine kinase [Paenibacillus sp. MBLB4367]|uniref:cache domain-containing sensor histidine kinase n=1 Tax=Paenibacillus sp. MBLB4367 TaxID=3384767 RepID=UPI00390811F2